MKKLIATSIISWFLLSGCGQESANKDIQPDKSLSTNEAFIQILNTYKVPAIGGLIMRSGDIQEQFSLGKRATESSVDVESSDLWHLGSITKSFTATLTAKLVELGYLDWNTTIGDVFYADEYPVSLSDITIEQLLSHSAGIASNILEVNNWEGYFTPSEDIIPQRLSLAKELLKISSKNNPGKFSYSNGSFVIAGAMLERVMSDNWENLLTHYILLPLDIQDAQFGAPDLGYDFSQPYGHLKQGNGWKSVSPNERYSDNPLAMGPAGTLSMSIESLAKYANEHILGHKGESDLLSADSFQKLHSEVSNLGYGAGWYINNQQISHSGSNTMWYAHLGIDLSKELVVIAVTNVGGDSGIGVTDNITNVLLDRNGNY